MKSSTRGGGVSGPRRTNHSLILVDSPNSGGQFVYVKEKKPRVFALKMC